MKVVGLFPVRKKQMKTNSLIERKASDVPISKITFGRVVKTVPDNGKDDDFGHVVGFTRNMNDEIILRVQWSRASDEISTIHPNNVLLVD